VLLLCANVSLFKAFEGLNRLKCIIEASTIIHFDLYDTRHIGLGQSNAIRVAALSGSELPSPVD
jgi:hypothetical protein